MDMCCTSKRMSQNAWLLYLLEHLDLVPLAEVAEATEGQTKFGALGYFVDILLELLECLHATCNGASEGVLQSC